MNYLEEMMIYGSLAMMVWHWLSFLVIAWSWDRLFTGALKEASMSRYSDWPEYKNVRGC